MTTRTGVRRVATFATLILVATACAPLDRGVGSQPAETVLTFANGLDGHQELQAFADAVERESGGSMAIEFEDKVHRGLPDIEPTIIDDVVAGRYDMAWVAQRPWPGRGVNAFDALVAPLLIDSYPLEAAVLADPIADEMLAALKGTGTVGLGIVPGPIRYAATRDRPLMAASDLAGKVVAIDDTAVAKAMVESLDATAKGITAGGSVEDADAVVQQLGSILGNRFDQDLPNVSGLGLWPRPVIIIIGKPQYDALSGDQRTWLKDAIDAAVADQLAALPSSDATALVRLCENGTAIANPDAAQLAAFQEAIQPVHDRLARDPLTARAIARIKELKAGLGAAPALETCDLAFDPTPTPSARVGFPDGTYEAKASCDELQAFWTAHDTPTDKRIPCPIVLGFTLRDGKWTENYGGRWVYSFFGDHVQLGDFTLRWTYDGAQVTFSDIQGGNPDDASVWTLKPFVRIDDRVALPQVGFPDGTYRAEISVEEIQAWWVANDVPLENRGMTCPCRGDFTLRNGTWTGGDGSRWDNSFFGDQVTIGDHVGSFTMRWSWDGKAVTFSDMVGGDWGDRAVFTVKPWVRD